MKTQLAACLLAAAVSITSFAANAEERGVLDDRPSAAAMTFDLLLVRPISLLATVAGVGIFVLQTPFALMRGESPIEPAQRLVVEPARYTFTRGLGSNSDE